MEGDDGEDGCLPYGRVRVVVGSDESREEVGEERAELGGGGRLGEAVEHLERELEESERGELGLGSEGRTRLRLSPDSRGPPCC